MSDIGNENWFGCGIVGFITDTLRYPLVCYDNAKLQQITYPDEVIAACLKSL